MSEPGTRRAGAAHRAQKVPLRKKPAVWAVTAAIVVLAATAAGFLVPWHTQGPDRSETAIAANERGTDSPVVVAHYATPARDWTQVLGDPTVSLGRPPEDAGTTAAISRALAETEQQRSERETTRKALRLRARTEGDATPVRDATERLSDVERSPQTQAPQIPDANRAAVIAVTGEPKPSATVVTREQWESYQHEHPDTGLRASTPGDRSDGEFRDTDATALQAAVDEWHTLARPVRALLTIDVSDSMKDAVPGQQVTRMDLTRNAAETAISLFPDHDAMGLWVFARMLDDVTDHRELAPVETLDAPDGAGTHRELLEREVANLQFTPEGFTGLYDTTLAAFRAALADDSPDSLRTVVLITDGVDLDPGSIGLENLIALLQKEQDQDNPVRVVTVGISDEADRAALDSIARATGGTSHVATSSEDLQDVLVRALTGA